MAAPPRSADLSTVKALLFDVFGTIVDWRTSVQADLAAWGARRGVKANWQRITDEWRGLYQPSMEEVRAGRRAFAPLDDLHRESLETLLARHGLDDTPEEDRDYLAKVWHRLAPWPDCVPALTRLKQRATLATLSNGNIALMVNLARYAGLPWDVILGAEVAQAYKPEASVYLKAAALLDLEPHQCMMVAAHNYDHHAAQALGMRTAMIFRPTEYGPAQTTDLEATGPWDIITDSLGGVADALGA
ncbi:MAG: haloacid dehalogenase type II [Pseudomonadota bacterium]